MLQSVGANGKPADFLSVEQKLAQALGERIVVEKVAQKASNPLPPPRVKPPAKLKTKTAIEYSVALSAMDKGDKPKARAHLQAVVKEQPDFKLAALNLDKMMQ